MIIGDQFFANLPFLPHVASRRNLARPANTKGHANVADLRIGSLCPPRQGHTVRKCKSTLVFLQFLSFSVVVLNGTLWY